MVYAPLVLLRAKYRAGDRSLAESIAHFVASSSRSPTGRDAFAACPRNTSGSCRRTGDRDDTIDCSFSSVEFFSVDKLDPNRPSRDHVPCRCQDDPPRSQLQVTPAVRRIAPQKARGGTGNHPCLHRGPQFYPHDQGPLCGTLGVGCASQNLIRDDERVSAALRHLYFHNSATAHILRTPGTSAPAVASTLV
jgi:hypothetical protein